LLGFFVAFCYAKTKNERARKKKPQKEVTTHYSTHMKAQRERENVVLRSLRLSTNNNNNIIPFVLLSLLLLLLISRTHVAVVAAISRFVSFVMLNTKSIPA